MANRIDFDDEYLNSLNIVSESYAVWYLQSHEPIRAPYSDMTALLQMCQYKEITSHPEAVQAVSESLKKHSWYLDSTLIPLALLDDDVLPVQKKIATAILKHSTHFTNVSQFIHKTKPKINVQKLNIDPKSESPSLESLVDDYSMFIFLSIGITRKNLEDFFALPPEYRLTQSCFQTF